MNKIGFIGTGNMGTAIIKGIANSSLSKEIALFATDIDKTKLNSLKEFGTAPLENAQEICKNCKYIFLAVKPQMFDELLDDISSFITEEKVIISIAAGITDDYIKARNNFV